MEGTHAAIDAIPGRGVLLLHLLASLLWLPEAALLAFAVDGLARHGEVPHLWKVMAALAALGLGRALLEARAERLTFHQARRALSALRRRAIRQLAARSPMDAGQPAAGVAAGAIAEEASAILPWLMRHRPAMWRAAVVPLVILCCVAPLSWLAAAVLFITMPLIPLFMALIGARSADAARDRLAETISAQGFLLDRLRGLATIRAFDAVEGTARQMADRAEARRMRTMDVLRIAFLSSAVLELFAALGIAMVAVFIGFHLLGDLPFGMWGRRLSLGEGLFILLLAPAFFAPLRDLSAVWHDRAAGEAAWRALDALARGGTSFPGTGRAGPPATTGAPSVRIAGLTFAHAGGAELFSALDLDVAAGEHVALLAPSGAGKSTLLALIAGLLAVGSGAIRINGMPLTDDTAASLRAGMAWFGGAPHVFPGTMAENLRLGRRDIPPAVIRRALDLAGLADLARARGAEVIGENGVGLSGGEAARLALARLALPPVPGLILADEPTAHLDAETAADITRALRALAARRTLIVATHDPILARGMDRIIRLPVAGGGA